MRSDYKTASAPYDNSIHNILHLSSFAGRTQSNASSRTQPRQVAHSGPEADQTSKRRTLGARRVNTGAYLLSTRHHAEAFASSRANPTCRRKHIYFVVDYVLHEAVLAESRHTSNTTYTSSNFQEATPRGTCAKSPTSHIRIHNPFPPRPLPTHATRTRLSYLPHAFLTSIRPPSDTLQETLEGTSPRRRSTSLSRQTRCARRGSEARRGVGASLDSDILASCRAVAQYHGAGLGLELEEAATTTAIVAVRPGGGINGEVESIADVIASASSWNRGATFSFISIIISLGITVKF